MTIHYMKDIFVCDLVFCSPEPKAHNVSYSIPMVRCPSVVASVVFDPILFILAGNEDMHKISDMFKFWPDRTTD